jgi:hypothetical protein
MTSAIKKRAAKLGKLRKRFNEAIDKMPEHLEKPEKLDLKIKLANLDFTADFWDLDMAFEQKEKWALDINIRDAINAMCLNLRALEEISMLCDEAGRYSRWLVSRLDECERLLSVIDVNSAIGERILLVGRKTAAALKNLQKLESVSLGDVERFKLAQETLCCNSHIQTRAHCSTKQAGP